MRCRRASAAHSLSRRLLYAWLDEVRITLVIVTISKAYKFMLMYTQQRPNYKILWGKKR